MGGGERVIATLEHSDGRLDGGYRGRADAVRKCAQGISNLGVNQRVIFAHLT